MAADTRPWVSMMKPNGSIVEVHPDDVEKSQMLNGYVPYTPELAEQRKFEAEMTTADTLKAFGEHFAKGLTFGLSDAVLGSTTTAEDVVDGFVTGRREVPNFPGYTEARRRRDIARPVVGTAAEFVGGVAPALIPGGATGLLARGARAVAAPARGVAATSRAVGTATERLVAGGATTGLRAGAAKIAGGVAEGAVEGVAWGAGEAISEASIQNKPLTAELVRHHVKNNLLVGAGLGAVIPGARLAFRGAGKAVSHVAGYTPGIGQFVQAAAGPRGYAGFSEQKILQSFGFLGSDLKAITRQGGPDTMHAMGRAVLTALEEAGEGTISAAAKRDLQTAHAFAQKQRQAHIGQLDNIIDQVGESHPGANAAKLMAEIEDNVISQYRNSLDGNMSAVVRRLEKAVDPIQRMVRRADNAAAVSGVADEVQEHLLGMTGARTVGGFTGRANALRDALEKHSRVFRRLGDRRLVAAVKELDKRLAAASRIGFEPIRRGQVGPAFERHMGRLGEAANDFSLLAKEVGASSASPTIPWRQLRDTRASIDDSIAWSAHHKHPAEAGLRKLRSAYEDAVERQVSATGLGPEYSAAKKQYGYWTDIEEVSKARIGTLAGSRSMGLSDNMSAGFWGTTGAALGYPIAGPAGSVAGGLMGTAVGGSVSRFLRSERADAIVAAATDKYARLQALRAAENESKRRIASAVGKAVDRNPVRLMRRASIAAVLHKDTVEPTVDDQLKLAESMQPVAEAAPDTATEIFAAEQRIRGYMAARNPEMNQAVWDSYVSIGITPEPPPSAKEAWAEIGIVVEDPAKLATAAANGSITPQQVQAVQQTSPNAYRLIQATALNRFADKVAKGAAPDIQGRLALSVLTNTPLEPSLSKQAVRQLQDYYRRNRAPAQQQTPYRGGMREGNAASKFAGRRASLTNRSTTP